MGSHRDGGRHLPTAHHDVDTLMRYAEGQLSAGEAHAVSRHLEVCEDGRCSEFIRTHARDPDAAGDWIDTSEGHPAEALRARTFRSREIVWATFESMARELAIPIDELVNDAMVAFAQARGFP